MSSEAERPLLGRADGEARLLVVEDEPTILELLSGSLWFAGFDVVTAASGVEALRVTAAARPDLILLDVMMPDADGFEVIRPAAQGRRRRTAADPYHPRHGVRPADSSSVTLWPRLRIRTRLGNASLRMRVMIAAAVLVTSASAVTGLLGTTLLRSYRGRACPRRSCMARRFRSPRLRPGIQDTSGGYWYGPTAMAGMW